jgi:hypothetical protein
MESLQIMDKTMANTSKPGADMTDEQLSDANKQACEWTDDWSERQEKEPSKEQSDAMFVRKLTELLAPVAIDKEVKTNDQERPGRVNDAAGRNRSLSGISIENAPQLSEGQQALSFAIGRLHIAASPLTHSANVAGLIQEAIDRLNWLGANPELLARQPAAIDKETECNCASNPHAEGCPVTAHVRAMFAASGESAYGAAPLDKEAGKPAAPYSAPFTTDVPQCCGDPSTCNDPCQPEVAPSVEQDERGAVSRMACTVDGDEITAIRKASELMCAMGYPGEASQITCFLARISRAASTSANVAQGAGDVYGLVYEWDTPYGVHRDFQYCTYNGAEPSRTVTLYSAPPARIALTDDRVSEIIDEYDDCSWIDGELRIDCKDMMRLARALLAAAQSASASEGK